jgi:uncharacterized membrane protein YphA (DoxX/SURF4 family)
MTTATTTEPDAFVVRRLGQGMAALRIFVGLILFSNGLSKLFGFTVIDVGPYRGTLIDRPGARFIMDFEVNRRNGDGTDVPLLKSIVNDVILANWGLFEWVVTALELGAGAALIVGFATRGIALLAFGQQFFLQIVYASSGRWMWEQPHEWVPLVILALVPAGRVWGLDRRLVGRGSARWRGWPF